MVDLRQNEKVLRDIDLIIFDKDGTLFQLYPFWSVLAHLRAKAIQDALNVNHQIFEEDVVKSMGVDDKNRRMFSEGPIGIFPRKYIMNVCLEAMERNGLSGDLVMVDNAFKKADQQINEETVLRKAIVPMPGAIEFIRKVNGRCKLAIFSSDTTPRLEQIARLFDIHECFQSFLGGDRTERSKPDSWGAKKIMGELCISEKRACFIGDAIVDMQCGKAAGMAYFIGIKSDITDMDILGNDANFIIEGYDEIIVL